MSELKTRLDQVAYAVVDVETTGFGPGDRIVEASVVHIAPGLPAPQLAFDTIVNPLRSVGPTQIHRIRQSDVIEAPTMKDLVVELVHSLCGAVVVAHNASFDLRFLLAEVQPWVPQFDPPSLCTMGLAKTLGFTGRSLVDLCASRGIPFRGAHQSGSDALATAFLLLHCLAEARARGLRTFEDVARLKEAPPRIASGVSRRRLHGSITGYLKIVPKRRSRAEAMGIPIASPLTAGDVASSSAIPQPDYLFSLVDALTDGTIDDEELSRLKEIRAAQQLDKATVRAHHARVFQWALSDAVSDHRLDEDEAGFLARVWHCLASLGWAPGCE